MIVLLRNSVITQHITTASIQMFHCLNNGVRKRFNTFTDMPNFSWVPSLDRAFAKVPAGYLLWCWCTAKLHVCNWM